MLISMPLGDISVEASCEIEATFIFLLYLHGYAIKT